MGENNNKSFWQILLGSKAVQVFVGMILGGLLMLTVVRFLYPNASSVQITLPGGKSMGVSVESNQVEYQKLLQDMFEQENIAREGMLKWLKEKQGLYQIKDPSLVNELSGMLPDKPKAGVNESFQERTER